MPCGCNASAPIFPFCGRELKHQPSDATGNFDKLNQPDFTLTAAAAVNQRYNSLTFDAKIRGVEKLPQPGVKQTSLDRLGRITPSITALLRPEQFSARILAGGWKPIEHVQAAAV